MSHCPGVWLRCLPGKIPISSHPGVECPRCDNEWWRACWDRKSEMTHQRLVTASWAPEHNVAPEEMGLWHLLNASRCVLLKSGAKRFSATWRGEKKKKLIRQRFGNVILSEKITLHIISVWAVKNSWATQAVHRAAASPLKLNQKTNFPSTPRLCRLDSIKSFDSWASEREKENKSRTQPNLIHNHRGFHHCRMIWYQAA